MLSPQYIAGLFDGEGSIGVYSNGEGTYYLRTQLTQNVGKASEDLMLELVNQFGGHHSIQDTSHGRKFNWQLSSGKAAAFLAEIEPHLRLKKEQAEIVRLWWAQRPKQERDEGGRFVTRATNLDADVARLVKALKKDDLLAVMSAQADLVEVVHTLKQVLCVKG